MCRGIVKGSQQIDDVAVISCKVAVPKVHNYWRWKQLRSLLQYTKLAIYSIITITLLSVHIARRFVRICNWRFFALSSNSNSKNATFHHPFQFPQRILLKMCIVLAIGFHVSNKRGKTDDTFLVLTAQGLLNILLFNRIIFINETFVTHTLFLLL